MFLSVPPAIGLDISDTGLKTVWLKKSGRRIVIQSFGSLTLDEGLISRGEIRNPKEVALKIKKLLKEAHGAKIYSERAVVNLPETRTFIKVVDVNLDPGVSQAEALKKEVEKHFPISMAESYVSSEMLQTGSRTKKQLLLGVAPQKVVGAYLDLIQLSGLTPAALEIEAQALARSLVKLPSPILPIEESAKLILDLGANRSSVIVYDGGIVRFSLSLPISGKQITTEIAQTLKLGLEQAEQVKRMCGLDEKRCQGALRELITLLLSELIGRIQDTVSYYYDNFSNPHAVDQVILCGGGAKLIGLKAHLSKALKLPVVSGNPMINFNLKSRDQMNGFPPDQALQYATSIGLAMGGLEI